MKDKLGVISLVIGIIATCVATAALIQSQESQRVHSNFDSFSPPTDSSAVPDRIKFVLLDPAEKGYQRLDTDNAFFFVSCEDAQPYLDGQKLTIRIGNPFAVRFVGFTVTVQWGRRYTRNGADNISYAMWKSGLKTKEFSFPTALEPARWSEVELILPATSVDQIGYLEVSMKTNTVSLSAPQK
jgi:hypothetical protein